MRHFLWLVILSMSLGCEFREDSCFAAGTQIDTPNGSVAIEQLEVGDTVWSYNTATNARVASKVTRAFVHRGARIRTLGLENGRTLGVTAGHPIYLPSEKRYVPASELPSGALLLSVDSAGVQDLAANYGGEEETATVYNIEVAGFHNYFAEGVLVHNKSPVPVDADRDGLPNYRDCDDNDPNITTECRDAGMDGGMAVDAGTDGSSDALPQPNG